MPRTKITDNVKVDYSKKVIYVDFEHMDDADRNAISLFNGFEYKPLQRRSRAKSGGNNFLKQSEYQELLSADDYQEFLTEKSKNGYFSACSLGNEMLAKKKGKGKTK